MHTTVSDGTDTPAELLKNVKKAGIDMFAVTDHDAIKGCGQVADFLKDGDPLFICGVEFSCRDDRGRYHILGYDYDINSEHIRSVVDRGHGLRMKKAAGRLEGLKEKFGFVFSDKDVAELMKKDNPGKPHIGNMMTKYGYASNMNDAIKRYLNKIKTPSEYIRPEMAIEGILAAGGIPVLAHPSYGNGEQYILGDNMDERLKYLTGMGLRGVEVFYSGFTDKIIAELLGFAEKYDLYITAGSDYHGSNKLVKLADTNLESTKNAPAGLRRFLDKILEKDRRR